MRSHTYPPTPPNKQHILGVKLNGSVNCSRRLPRRVEGRLWSVVWRQVNAVCSLCVGGWIAVAEPGIPFIRDISLS